jgi:hypothetical protein
VESVTASFKETILLRINEQIHLSLHHSQTNISVMVVIEPSSSEIALGLVSLEFDHL